MIDTLITRNSTPALHAFLARAPVARLELEAVIAGAIDFGRRNERDLLAPQIEGFLGLVDKALGDIAIQDLTESLETNAPTVCHVLVPELPL